MGVTLFRVLQEALQNAIKHGQIKRAEVRLREESGQLRLVVSDSASAFDAGEVLRGRGLGSNQHA
jgi:signal transduction histidine kinase